MTRQHSKNGWVNRLSALPAPLILFGAAATVFAGAEMHVPADFPTIQSAINNAQAGDEIIVAPGVYHENIDFLGKSITLRSSAGPAATTIDGGGGTVVTCTSGEDSATTLEGFTITGGFAFEGGGMVIFNADPTIADCIITNNLADGPFGGFGGGVYIEAASPSFIDCKFLENTADYGGSAPYDYGGAIFTVSSTVTIANCTFSGNTADSGGAIAGGVNTISNCTFIDNTGDDDGGAIAFGTNTITNCTFENNTAHADGGAIKGGTNLVTGCSFAGNTGDHNGGVTAGGANTFINCTFTDNTAADGNGGVIYGHFGSNTLINCLVMHNTASNKGGGLHVANAQIINTTIVANQAAGELGGGVYVFHDDFSDNVTIANSIIWFNIVGAQLKVAADAAAAVSYTNIEGGWPGAGNIDAKPQFVDFAAADFHLLASSPGIESGSNDELPPDAQDLDNDGNVAEPLPVDLDGQARVSDGDSDGAAVVDMGAYEFQGGVMPGPPGDLNEDGCVDSADLNIVLGSFGCTGAGCAGDVNCDGATDSADLNIVLGHFGACM